MGRRERPSILYKYRPRATPAEEEVVRQIVRDCTLRFSKPGDFNDPLEFQVALDWQATREERLVHAREVARAEGAPEDEDSLWSWVTSVERQCEAAEHPNLASRFLTNELMHSGAVPCMSEPPDEPLMWSHYSDGHRGCCIGFDVEMLEESLGATFHRVEYLSSPPAVNPWTNDPSAWTRIFLSEHDGWSYEREWRAVRTGSAAIVVGFCRAAIRQLVFGVRVTEETVARVRGWLEGGDVRSSRAVPQPGSYALAIESID